MTDVQRELKYSSFGVLHSAFLLSAEGLALLWPECTADMCVYGPMCPSVHKQTNERTDGTVKPPVSGNASKSHTSESTLLTRFFSTNKEFDFGFLCSHRTSTTTMCKNTSINEQYH
ncbi:hypothetical protein AMECASPLE_023922 [Ameca splendens]|uniref:Secreted protein n=1 Tax=Ameca splendens TaxID=208324 RepID=A0ABV0YFW3_9TELE